MKSNTLKNSNSDVAVFDRCVRIKQVVEMVGFSKPTIYRLINKGTFPKPFNISTNCVVWRMSAIEDWIKEREAV
jgi:prophage regulatory protein